MPPLFTSIAIPVIERSPQRATPGGKFSVKNGFKPRTYTDEPLPVKPSEIAPRNARIKNRSAEADGVFYTLEIGGVTVDDVGLDEVLDYVSAYALEQYENEQFEQEREAMRVARLAEEAAKEARKQKAKTRGVVIVQSEDSMDSDEEEDVATGKHGRARPTYKHMFKKVKERRRRRKRDPSTGELLPLSDEDDGEAGGAPVNDGKQRRRRRKRDPATGELMPLSDEEDEPSIIEDVPAKSSPPERVRPPASPPVEIPKRRRRKRDKVTGVLLPLSPIAQQSQSVPSSVAQEASVDNKRPRRRRHPVTRELMPLGWRYNPDEDDDTDEQTQNGGSAQNIPSMNRLSIAREHQSKRMKLTSEEPSSDDRFPARTSINSPKAIQATPRHTTISTRPSKIEIEESESDGLEDPSDKKAQLMSAFKSDRPPPKTSLLNPTARGSSRSAAVSSAADTSPEPPMTLASFLKPSTREDSEESSSEESSSSSPDNKVKTTPGAKTSIMKPVAAEASSEEEVEENDEELEEGEWFVEAILDHRMSDPQTHPGIKQAMLYKTKWEGWGEPTWEPVDSFADQSVINEYRKRVGLDGSNKKAPTLQPKLKKEPTSPPRMPMEPTVIVEESGEDEEDEEEEEDYDVEKILAHHMSDPRTHKGRPPVMLYQVKWVGWEKPTWEPRVSFTDKTIVRRYEQRVGLHGQDEDDDGDVEMDM